MRNKYYVIAKTVQGEIIPKRCGLLWAASFSEAEIETGKYRDKSNRDYTIQDKRFMIIDCVPHAVARTNEYWNEFNSNRVTTKPTPPKKKSLRSLS